MKTDQERRDWDALHYGCSEADLLSMINRHGWNNLNELAASLLGDAQVELLTKPPQVDNFRHYVNRARFVMTQYQNRQAFLDGTKSKGGDQR